MIVVGKIVIEFMFRRIKIIISLVGNFLPSASSFKHSNAFKPVEVVAIDNPNKLHGRVIEIYSRAFEFELIPGKINFKILDKYLLIFFKKPLSFKILKIPFQNNIISDILKKVENASFVLDKTILPSE